jgi:hypothetical protein
VGRLGQVAFAAVLAGAAAPGAQQGPPGHFDDPPPAVFFAAAASDDSVGRQALQQIERHWRTGYVPLLVDIARLLPSPRRRAVEEDRIDLAGDFIEDPRRPGDGAGPPAHLPPGANARRRITDFLGRRTSERFGDDLRAWRRWMWSQPYEPHARYPEFKRTLYSQIDPRLGEFFPDDAPVSIRLDEIDWGGVPVNGIPPLRAPKTIAVGDATWLKDSHVVFGVVIDGQARAYPKRILAWHEMAIDRLGGVDLTIVYCTLCGTVIPYESASGGRRFTFGTSGLLYRSNKLMFDEETRSLWSALDGTPVVGPLVGRGLRLPFRPVVTTTWGEWRRDHPGTTVLSLDTGYQRDYSEGAAYRDYFSTDNLMFEVGARDGRLKNKAEVLVLRRELLGADARPVAVSVDLLRRQPLFSFEAAGRGYVVVTSRGGANRVYERGDSTFVARQPDGRIRDSAGGRWRVEPDRLVSDAGLERPAVPAHRAFWFGWYAQHPDTVLHK